MPSMVLDYAVPTGQAIKLGVVPGHKFVLTIQTPATTIYLGSAKHQLENLNGAVRSGIALTSGAGPTTFDVDWPDDCFAISTVNVALISVKQ